MSAVFSQLHTLFADISALDNHIISHSQPQLDPQASLEVGVAPGNSLEVTESGEAAIPPSLVSASSVFTALDTNNAPSSSQDFRDAADALL
jgi:hypothetical protein